jgi:hypothetical protein
MTLSFRDEAALIAFRLSANNSNVGREVPAEMAIKGIAVASAQAAQALADACCAQFGHTGGFSSRQSASLDRPCERCGRKI